MSRMECICERMHCNVLDGPAWGVGVCIKRAARLAIVEILVMVCGGHSGGLSCLYVRSVRLINWTFDFTQRFEYSHTVKQRKAEED